MRELITLSQSQIGNETIETVNARDLHTYLGARKDFSDWIKYQINTFGFEENQDFIIDRTNGEQCFQGVSTKIEYFLTLDMGKELAMMSRCRKGKQARQYFIECEKQLKAPKDLSKTDLAHMIIESEQELAVLKIENQRQECEITNLAPKAESFDKFLQADGLVNLEMSMREIGRKPKLAIGSVKRSGVFFAQGRNPNTPKAIYVERGYFVVKPSKPNRDGKTYPQTFVTPRGVAWLDKVVPEDLRV